MGAVCYGKESQIYNSTEQILLIVVSISILFIFVVFCNKISQYIIVKNLNKKSHNPRISFKQTRFCCKTYGLDPRRKREGGILILVCLYVGSYQNS